MTWTGKPCMSSREGDTWLPEWNPEDWKQLGCEQHAPDDRNPYPYRFELLERRQ